MLLMLTASSTAARCMGQVLVQGPYLIKFPKATLRGEDDRSTAFQVRKPRHRGIKRSRQEPVCALHANVHWSLKENDPGLRDSVPTSSLGSSPTAPHRTPLRTCVLTRPPQAPSPRPSSSRAPPSEAQRLCTCRSFCHKRHRLSLSLTGKLPLQTRLPDESSRLAKRVQGKDAAFFI